MHKIAKLSALAYTTLCLGSPFAQGKSVLDAIWQVESSSRTTCPAGDGGRAIGPLQIHRACWLDSKVPGQYSDCQTIEYSRLVFTAYCRRYKAVSPEACARLWNAGPNWRAKLELTDKYWTRVQKEMDKP